MAKLTDSTYEIARPSGVCAATQRPLEVGQTYVAALVEREGEEGLQRLDYSLEAWEAGARPQAPLRLFGSWRSVMSPASDAKRPFIDDDALADLLEQLEGADEPSRQSFRYVLALMLVRKRLFKFEGSRRDDAGRNVMMLRRATPSGSTPADGISVIDPGMDDAAVAAAIEQLGSVMAGEAQG
jgi:hypothetical protein